MTFFVFSVSPDYCVMLILNLANNILALALVNT